MGLSSFIIMQWVFNVTIPYIYTVLSILCLLNHSFNEKSGYPFAFIVIPEHKEMLFCYTLMGLAWSDMKMTSTGAASITY